MTIIKTIANIIGCLNLTRAFIKALILMILSSFSELFFYASIGYFLAESGESNQPLVTYFANSLELSYFQIASIFIGIAAFLKLFFNIITAKEISDVVSITQYKLTIKLYDKLIFGRYHYVLSNSRDEILKRLTTDVHLFVNSGFHPLIILIQELIVLVLLGLAVLIYNPVAAFISGFVIAIAFVVIHVLTKRRLVRLGDLFQQLEGEKYAILNQTTSGFKELKVFNLEERFHELSSTILEKIKNVQRLQGFLTQLSRPIIEFFLFLAVISLVTYLILTDHRPEQIFSLVSIFAFAAFRLLPSASRIIWAVQLSKYASESAKTIQMSLNESLVSNTLASRSTEISNIKMTESPMAPKRVQIDGFSYSEGYQLLKNTSLDLQLGKTIGLVGPSGSGKTTFVDVLLGLIGDKGVKRNYDSSIFAYVPQNVSLFKGSLVENLTLTSNSADVDLDKLANLIDSFDLDNLVKSLPGGFETQLTGDAAQFSGGERQRFGLVRAFYSNRKYIVLDEATSALDQITERKVLSAISKLKADKFILFVTHRESVFDICDCVYLLNDGSLELKR